MTTLETRIYSHPPIPLADISPLEMLILTNVLECSETEEGLVLFTDFGPTNPVRVPRSELIAAFRASSQYAEDPLNIFIADRVLSLLPAGGNTVEDDPMIDIDLSQFPWQFVVKGIVARSTDMHEVTVTQWMNHPSQRPESFGAGVSLITAKAIHHATSEDLLARFRLQNNALPPVASSVASPEDDVALTGGASIHDERFSRRFHSIPLDRRSFETVEALLFAEFCQRPADLRVSGSRQSRDFTLRHPPDPGCDLRSRLDHVRKRLLKFLSGARRHDEHGDGSRLLFR